MLTWLNPGCNALLNEESCALKFPNFSPPKKSPQILLVMRPRNPVFAARSIPRTQEDCLAQGQSQEVRGAIGSLMVVMGTVI